MINSAYTPPLDLVLRPHRNRHARCPSAARRAQRGGPKVSAARRMTAAAPTPASFLERAPLLLRDFATGALPEPWRWLVNSAISIAVILAVFGLLFAFLTLAERKILGRVQNRPGPNRTGYFGLLQPFADAVKMLTKEDIVPRNAH